MSNLNYDNDMLASLTNRNQLQLGTEKDIEFTHGNLTGTHDISNNYHPDGVF